MNSLLSIVFLAFASFSPIKDCDCSQDFEFVVNTIEKDHPGFKINVNKKNYKAYEAFKNSILSEIESANVDSERCVKLLNKYLTFIKDKHLRVYDPSIIDEEAYDKKLKTKGLPSFKAIDEETNYVRVPSFSANLWRELDQFYDSITPLVKAKENLIVDIRNNGGGGERMYKQLLQIIKKDHTPEHVVVLFNRRCASACEEVALKVSNMKKVVTLGQNTNGQFAYGFIKGVKTPSCGYTLIITTKKYPSRLKYEYVGVEPQIKLKENEDALAAALEHLKNF